ncbi:HAMP domain-containing sensor histidine kinase [Hyphomicrobium sp. NDB2Meth4]|uniref:sensor histidine kinase n=1 Tax=Hyphomicrobium sp. NDB2Meth4 TaxID=1892846 RepID=UPI0009309284|nr:HAMP domain-containing sensor histidine kinase [Hyphomicrobium sp. NDB2Meth4]
MADIPPHGLDLAILANFVHQVINPLNGVCGTLDNLVDGTISQARSKQRLNAARAQLEQAIVLVRNLAYFSEMSAWESGVIPANHVKSSCLVPEIIIQAAMFFQELGATKHIEILLENPNDQFRVEGNADLLRQVFMNLFDNGVKYGKRNTQILIRTWTQRKTGALLVRVSGRSMYIPVEEQQQLFDLGFRGREARDTLASGSGLGLYICRRILDLFHSATIEVESSSPVGDIAFLIRFPVQS